MADKNIVATLKKLDGKDVLSFQISESKKDVIDLNSDDQTHLKELFYDLIQLLFTDDITLSLDFDEGYDQNNIFANVAKEYLKALGDEIKTVKQNLPQKL
ncbi:MAG TPA: hypothetical protein PK941_10005 [Paludibacter sp.]|nr:hypothetical protein [Paludibacter sp.]